MNKTVESPFHKFLEGGGEMGALIRAHNWAATSLGNPDSWPQSLRSALSICLNSGFPIGIYWGADFTLIYNDAWSPIPGGKHPYALGRPGQVVWPEIWDLVEAQFNDVLTNGHSVRSKDTLLPMNRYGYVEECYFDYTLSPIFNADGTVGGIFNAVIETTYKVINERRNIFLHRLVQQINVVHSQHEGYATGCKMIAVAIEDIPFCLFYGLSGNHTMLVESCGLSKEQAGNLCWPFEEVSTSGTAQLVTGLQSYIPGNITGFWPEPCTEALLLPLRDGQEVIVGYMIAGISPRKRLDKEYWHFLETVAAHMSTAIANGSSAEEERKVKMQLAASEQRFRSLIEEATVATAVLRGEDRVLELANDAMLNIWDRDKAIIGKRLLDFMPELAGQPFPRILHEVYTTGVTYTQDDALVLIKRKGRLEEVYMDFSYKALRDNDNVITGILVAATDVTEKVFAKKQLEESETNLRNIILQAPVAMCILRGPEHIVEIANDRMFELWGKRSGELLNKPIFEGLPEVKGQGFEELLYNVYTTGETFTAYGVPTTLPRGGTLEVVYLNFVYEAFREANGGISGVMAVASDVTELMLAQQKIQQSEASFRLLANSMPQLIWTADVQGNLNYFNQAVYDYSGLTFNEIKGDGWLQIIHPDEQAENVRLWMQSMQTGEDFIFHHRFKNREGEYRWQLSRAVPQRDAAGKIQLWVGTSTDIHDQKLFEEVLQTKVNERTAELERKNSELQQFAHVSSHDLQEPLRKIRMFISMIKDKDYGRLSDESKIRFTKIEDASLRMSTSLRDLLNFTSLDREAQFTIVDLNEVLSAVLTDLELVVEQKGAVVHSEPLPVIRAIPLQMHQLLYNLVNNALKFSKPDVPPQITITVKELSVQQIEQYPHLHTGRQYIELTVKDNGIGFDPTNAERIFTIFQRLHSKQQYSGTGIGLALCKKVALNHAGDIYATSRPGSGAAFNVLLPLA